MRESMPYLSSGVAFRRICMKMQTCLEVSKKRSQSRKILWTLGVPIPVILALKRQRQKDCEFSAKLSYVVRSCLKQKIMGKSNSPAKGALYNKIL
jgi:hypothetical protein